MQHSCCYHFCVSSPQESLPAVVRRPTLPCVWPMALSSTKRSEVNRWFDQSLKNYLVFLTKSLISPKITYNSSCVAFQKLYVAQPVLKDCCCFFEFTWAFLMFFSVSVLGVYNYTAVDFMSPDVYNTIRTYLTSGSTMPTLFLLPLCFLSAKKGILFLSFQPTGRDVITPAIQSSTPQPGLPNTSAPFCSSCLWRISKHLVLSR